MWRPEICLIQKSSRLATKKLSQNKKTGFLSIFYISYNFISLFFASKIAEMIIKKDEKTVTIT